ncbi:MAG TPA: MATE family efflux transporter, partial [Clostridia bacterium]|nr:MATE family efflux transporter [Clostridia bacterium]
IKTNYILLKDFFKYGFPVILGDIFWGLNLTVQGIIIGRLGSTAQASVSIANIVFSLISVGCYGTSGATSVIIGQTVGAGEYEKVKEYAKKLQLLFLIIGFISGAILYLIKDYILLLYNISEDTIALSRQLIVVLSVTIIGTSYQMSSLTGIVRAGGAIYFVLINDLIFVWLVVIPSALIAHYVFNAPPAVVFACLKCDQILKCGVAVVKVNRFKWIQNLTRDAVAVSS